MSHSVGTHREATGSARSGRAAILIVDDRPDKLLVYQTILEDLQQNLFTAASGEQALKQVLERDFAVILLDVNMPGLDGIETAALIRKRSRSAHIPIIFITADYSDDTMVRGYALGAVDYIASPIVPEILQAKVKVFVDLYLLALQAQEQALEHIVLAEEKAARAAARAGDSPPVLSCPGEHRARGFARSGCNHARACRALRAVPRRHLRLHACRRAGRSRKCRGGMDESRSTNRTAATLGGRHERSLAR